MGVRGNGRSRLRLRAEFTTEPFYGEGDPPRHAVHACERVREAGLEPEFGPLGTALSGDRDSVLRAVTGVLETVLDEGATRITLQVSTEPGPDDEGPDEPTS